ncbi:MAG TPA: mycofactocin system transcriptional regulator [Rugosimonospora sp.]|nr:mycofactocin system transcriptional regulator [Rugosimonospora sp.]
MTVHKRPDARPEGNRPRAGRPQATTRAALEAVAFQLFAAKGFDETSIEDITATADIGRRTFFRYYASKNDLVWGDFAGELRRLRAWFAAVTGDVPLMEAIRRGVVEFNRYPAEQQPRHRERMALILDVPSLRANSTLRFVQWRGVIAEFAAQRLGLRPDDLYPVVIGHCALGAALAAYEAWLRDAAADLTALLDDALAVLTDGFQPVTTAPASPRPHRGGGRTRAG